MIFVVMNSNQLQALQEFEVKLRNILRDYHKKVAECDVLKQTLNDKEREIKTLQEKNKELSQSYESLRITKTMLSSNSDVQYTKEKIDNLVREIDSCIALFDK